MSKGSLLLICMLLCLPAQAGNRCRQRARYALSLVDSLLEAYQKVRVDTNYISRPNTHWTLKVRNREYGNFVCIQGSTPTIEKFHSHINAPLKTTLGISANYRGLSVSLAMNPAKLLGDNSTRSFNTTLYNNRYGADFSASSTDNLTTNVWMGGEKWDMKLTDSHLQQLSAMAYYVLSGRKFSYPAAFTHSWIQRRSAGSFLVSASLYMGRFKSSFDDQTGYLSLDKKITMQHVSLGGGYAYNYVPSKRWLLHISAVPHIILWHNYRYSMTQDPNTQQPLEKKIPNKNPGIHNTGRLSATYSWQHYFAGLTGIVQTSHVGIGNEAMRAGNTHWRGELFFGLRL